MTKTTGKPNKTPVPGLGGVLANLTDIKKQPPGLHNAV
jgi:hypothetical protein